MFSTRMHSCILAAAVLAAGVFATPENAGAAPGDLLFTLDKPAQAGDRFGAALDGTADFIYVGDPTDDSQSSGTGAIHAYNALNGEFLYTIYNPAPDEGNGFGSELAVLPDGTLAAGVPLDDTYGEDAGVAYVFAPGTTVPLHLLEAPSPAAGDMFGASIAAAGGRIIVGAPNDDTATADGGAAFVFNAADGALVHTITGIVPTADSGFGTKVAATETHFAITHPGRDYMGIFDAATGSHLVTQGAVVDVKRLGNDFIGTGKYYSDRFRTERLANIRRYNASGGVFCAGSASISDPLANASAPSISGVLNNPVTLAHGFVSILRMFSGADCSRISESYDFPCRATLGSAHEKVLVGRLLDAGCPDAEGDGSVLVFEGPPPPAGPEAPTDLKATPYTAEFTHNFVRLTWTDIATNETHFEIVREDAAGVIATTNHDSRPSTGTATVVLPVGPPPPPDQDWALTYKIRACNLIGCSPYSNDAPYTVKPASPADLMTVVGPASQVSLVWMDRSGIETGYQVERRRFDEGYSVLATLPAGTTVYQDASAVPGTAYSFRVRALGPLLSSDFSNTADASTLAPPAHFVRTLTSPLPSMGEGFGFSVARLGERVIVGAPWSNATGTLDAGRVYVFDVASGAHQFTLESPAPQIGDRFGWSVAAVRGNILVGAPYADHGATDAGAAYLFSGRTGQLLTVLSNRNPVVGELFGFSVAPAGSNIIIGAPGNSSAFARSGVAYITDSRNKALRTLTNPTPAPGDFFGNSVAGLGDWVSVTAPGDDTGQPNSGSAYNFDWRQNSLLSQGNLAHAVASTSDGQFAVGVLDGTGGASPQTGFAYLMNPETGLPTRTFTNPAPADQDQFGITVAAQGADVAVGAPQADHFFADSGWVWVYDSVSGNAILRFDNPTPGTGDRFGAALCPVVNGQFAIGCPGDDVGGFDTGSVSIFQGRP